MKKIWMMLLMISTVFAFSACSDDDDEKVPVNPITGVTINSPVEIGQELIISGTGFTKDAEFYFKDAAGKLSEKIKGTITSTNASLIVPMSMEAGEYTLVLKQDGEWELGKVTLEPAGLPIDNLKLPAIAWINRDITIEGSGFNTTSEVYLQQEDMEPIKLPVSDYSAGLTVQIPADIEAGTYSVILKQDGGEWTLSGEIVVEKAPKRLAKITIETSIQVDYTNISEVYTMYGDYFGVTSEEEFKTLLETNIESMNGTNITEFVYDDNHKLTSITENNKELFAFSSSEKQIIGTNSNLKGESFTLNIENGKVVSNQATTIYGEGDKRTNSYIWHYSENGYLDVIKGASGSLYYTCYYKNGNFIGFEDSDFFTYDEPTWKNHIYGINVAMFLYSIATKMADEFFLYAIELGYTGTPSVNLPSQMMNMMGEYIPLTYTWNDEYVTSVHSEENSVDPITFMLPATTSITYLFEYAE